MADIQGLIFEPNYGLVICKVHCTAVHPSADSLRRHLRNKGHFCKGPILKQAVEAILQLSLRSASSVVDATPAVATQPVPSIEHLAVVDGWNCTLCHGRFLTASQELLQRHMSKAHSEHKRKQSTHWERCRLQTFFSMTGERRYFRVTERCPTPNSVAQERHDPMKDEVSEFLQASQRRRVAHRAIESAAANSVPDPKEDQGTELWMTKLGLSQYIAGLQKDEMATSYTAEDHEDMELQDLKCTTVRVLEDTWGWCQHGPTQRMTDPQAARISSFWSAADPEGKAKIFRRGIRKDTLHAYIEHWSQLLTFCWKAWRGKLFIKSLEALHADSRGRSASDLSDDGLFVTPKDDEKALERFVYLSPQIRCCLQAVVTASHSTDDPEKKEEPLAKAVTALSQSLIQQNLGQSPYRSPIMSYVAMRAVDPKLGCWEEPGSFNHHLSALVYCAQLWVFRFVCEQVDSRRPPGESAGADSDDGMDEALDNYMQKYFTNTVSKPLAYLLLWRRRLFGIAPLTMVNRPAWWNLEKTTVTYMGVSITMDEVRCLCRHTIDRARSLLYHDLMFGATHVAKIMPQHLHEDDSNRSMGWWFAHHPQNQVQLTRRHEVLIEHVVETTALRELYLRETKAGPKVKLAWRANSVKLYRAMAQDFLKDLAVAIHISAGPPVRAPEFQSPMWRNTEQLRHVQLRYGQVMIHLVEHKMMGTTGKNVNNIRFLCDELGELLVNYLVYVIPVLEAMAWQSDVQQSISPFLWSASDGTRWSARDFGHLIQAACRRAEVPVLSTSIWRQMSSSIINTQFDQADRACLDAALDQEAEVDEEGADHLAATLVSMSNHSLRTHRHAYANVNPFANVWDAKLVKSHHASKAWAQFFGLGGESEKKSRDTSHKRKRSTSGIEPTRAHQLLNIGNARTKRHWSSAALLNEARKLYRRDTLQWRCAEQEQAMRLVANRSPEVLLVLATGAGKSLTFMLGSTLPGSRTTIVIIPLVLLRLDLIRRCRTMGLDPVVWKNASDIVAGMDSTPTLLFASVEITARHSFRQYVQRLYDTGNLERFMIDECHLIHTSSHYRKTMTHLHELRQYAVPFIFLTATLPPRLERGFFQRHHISTNASVVRGRTKRSNIHYRVQHLRPPEDVDFVEHACDYIRGRWDGMACEAWTAARVLVFVRGCMDAEAVAERLKCSFYHSDLGSLEEKEACLVRWIDGSSGSPFLACTTAAGPGIDYPHVRWVIHLEDPYGMIDYAQESGRAGRDGEEAGASVLMRRDPSLPAPATPLDHPDPADDQAIKQYLSGHECRRLCMARELDVAEHWARCGSEDVTCDVCLSEESHEPSERPSEAVGQNPQDGQMKAAEAAALDGVVRQRRAEMAEQQEMDEYLWGLSQVQDGCMVCKELHVGRDWRHPLDVCPQGDRWRYFSCKKAVVSSGKGWMAAYAACYQCGQPQSVCDGWKGRRAGRGGCQYSDLVMPCVWALWEAGGWQRTWLTTQLEVGVSNAEEALTAAGRRSRVGGETCILGVRILAERLKTWQAPCYQGS